MMSVDSLLTALDVGRLYDAHANVIDLILYLFLFIPLAQATLGRYWPDKPGQLISASMGIALSIGLLQLQRSFGFTLRGLGPLAAVLLLALLGTLLFLWLRQLGASHLVAVGCAYLVLHFALQAVAPSLVGWLRERLPLIDLVAVIAGGALAYAALRAVRRPGRRAGAEAETVATEAAGEGQAAHLVAQEYQAVRQELAPGPVREQRQLVFHLHQLGDATKQLRVRVKRCRRLLERAQQLDIRAYADLRRQLRGAALAEQRRELEQRIRDDLSRLSVEERLQKAEAQLEKAERTTFRAVQQAATRLHEGRVDEARAALDQAAAVIEVLERAAQDVAALSSQLEALTRQKFVLG